jgi:tetratricopeptide (TPR) repeat protein
MSNLHSRRRTGAGMRIRSGAAIVALLLGGTACELDLANPNAPTQEQVLPDVDGLIALGVGLQNQYAGSVLTYVRAPALVSDEWGTAGSALPADISLLTGPADVIDPGYGVVSGPYFVTYRIVRTANLLIENAPQVERLGEGTTTGLVAMAKLFKAMALGNAILQFESIAIDADVEGAPVHPREVVLDTVIGLLKSARADLGSVSDAQMTTFFGRVLGDGFDLRNTVDAMLARYYLIDGQYQEAIDAAERVDLDVVSIFTYPNPDINPIYNYAIAANYVLPLRSFVDQAEEGDERPSFWVVTDPEEAVAPRDSLLTPLRQYSDRNDPYPVYIPDEMRLIQAEAYTRLGNFEAARDLINAVRTQTTSPAPTIVPAAGLPALPPEALDTEAELLNQIAYERRYELYEQGLRWEDMRRLDPYIEHEPVIQFLPFPTGECQSNPNVNC